ncbi:MAG: hypothetical protein U1E63_01555 [Burkholderiales bacterium]
MERDLHIGTPGHARQHISCTITPIEVPGWHGEWSRMLAEFRPIDQQLEIARDERILDQTEANRLLLRNLAHEIETSAASAARPGAGPGTGAPDLSEYTRR